jgi:hypothetical protein
MLVLPPFTRSSLPAAAKATIKNNNASEISSFLAVDNILNTFSDSTYKVAEAGFDRSLLSAQRFIKFLLSEHADKHFTYTGYKEGFTLHFIPGNFVPRHLVPCHFDPVVLSHMQLVYPIYYLPYVSYLAFILHRS